MTEIDAVFFDLGDTLVDLREGSAEYMTRLTVRAERVYEAIAPRCHALPARDAFTARVAHGTEAFYLAAVARQQGVDIYDALRHLFGEMDLPVDDGVVKAGGDAFCRSSALLPPLRAGGAEVLAALDARGLRLGVISNTLQPVWSMDEALERRGLLRLFATRTYSSAVRVAKPHPAIFREALGVMGVAPERTVYVGDRLMVDVAGAQGVGMRAILIEVPGRPEPDSDIVPDARIRELPELLDILLLPAYLLENE